MSSQVSSKLGWLKKVYWNVNLIWCSKYFVSIIDVAREKYTNCIAVNKASIQVKRDINSLITKDLTLAI